MRNINDVWKDDQELVKQNCLLLGQQSVQALFNGYYFDYLIFTNQGTGGQDEGKEVTQGKTQAQQSTTAKPTNEKNAV